MEQARGHCRNHGDTLITKQGTNHILHLLLSLITLGIWLPVWIVLAIKPGGWRCAQCGVKVLRVPLR